MTDDVTLKPCPFCGAQMTRYEGPLPKGFFHPHTMTGSSGTCFLSDATFYDADVERWNTRHGE